jgi:hypothetical protein
VPPLGLPGDWSGWGSALRPASLAVIAKLGYFVARLRRRYAQQLPALQAHRPVSARHEPAQVLPNRPAPPGRLEGRLSRVERRLAGDDPAPAINPPQAEMHRAPEVGRQSQTPASRG